MLRADMRLMGHKKLVKYPNKTLTKKGHCCSLKGGIMYTNHLIFFHCLYTFLMDGRSACRHIHLGRKKGGEGHKLQRCALSPKL